MSAKKNGSALVGVKAALQWKNSSIVKGDEKEPPHPVCAPGDLDSSPGPAGFPLAVQTWAVSFLSLILGSRL